MGQTKSKSYLLDGHCDSGYEPVKQHLEKMLSEGKEENLQLCVYVKEKCVVDLYGSAIGDKTYGPETVQTIYSSGKSIESIAMAMLYGKGLFKYEDKISKHWPAFGSNGKGDVTIAEVFRHAGGLSYFTESIPSIKDAWIENIKANKISDFIEKQPLHFPTTGDKKTEYHAQTRGMVINELVRRLDPKQRTIGEILREDIKIKGIYLGASSDANSDPVPQTLMSNAVLDYVFKLFGFLKSDQPAFMTELGTNFGQDFINAYNSPDMAKAEVPSVSFRANARGLGKLASIMANGGQGLMSEDAWKEMHSEPVSGEVKTMIGTGHYNFTKGGVNLYENGKEASSFDKNKFNKNREGYYGWMGFGGSIFQWHPQLRIGFAFVPTLLHKLDMVNTRGAVLQQIVKDCAQKQN